MQHNTDLSDYLARGGQVKVYPPGKKTPKAKDWDAHFYIRQARLEAQRRARRIAVYRLAREAGRGAQQAWNIAKGLGEDYVSRGGPQ